MMFAHGGPYDVVGSVLRRKCLCLANGSKSVCAPANGLAAADSVPTPMARPGIASRPSTPSTNPQRREALPFRAGVFVGTDSVYGSGCVLEFRQMTILPPGRQRVPHESR